MIFIYNYVTFQSVTCGSHLCYVSVSFMLCTVFTFMLFSVTYMLCTVFTFMLRFSQLHVVYIIYIYVTFQSVSCCLHYLHLCYVSISFMWFTLFTFMLRFNQFHVVHFIYIYVTFQSVSCGSLYLHLCYVSVSYMLCTVFTFMLFSVTYMLCTVFTFMLRFSQLHVAYIIYIYVSFQSVSCCSH